MLLITDNKSFGDNQIINSYHIYNIISSLFFKKEEKKHNVKKIMLNNQ